MNKKLRSELWEIQVTLMWILAFLLIHFSQSGFGRVLGVICLAWGFISFGATIMLSAQADKEERFPKNYE